MKAVFSAMRWLLLGVGLHGCAWVTKDELAASQDQDADDHIADQFGGDDCDDASATVFPGAEETCDGEDEDCNGVTDDVIAGDGTTWYTDADGDGAGDPASVIAACSQPEGAVATGTDCDDGDGAVSPSAAEACNGIDDDCDGLIDDADDSFAGATWYPDADGDGIGGDGQTTQTADCLVPEGYAEDGGDCDDADAAVSPGLDEVCDGKDNDCDSLIDDDDDGLVGVSTWYVDADTDGYGDPEVEISQCDAPPSFVDDARDCDDADPSIHPGAAEHCDDVDEDCDGEADNSAIDVTEWYTDADGDGWGDDATRITACDAPTGTVDRSGDCDDADPAVYPTAEEACTTEDLNCDGLPGATDDDGDGVRGCDSDCDDGDASIYPDAPETCDGVDDDCDGLVDDDDPDRVTTGLSTYYADADGDTYGDEADAGSPACSAPTGSTTSHTDCNDADEGVHPGATEVCSTAFDDDCDGSTTDCSASLSAFDLVFEGEAEGDRAGATLASADLDGDGSDDLAVGAPGRSSDKGSVYVVLDPSAGTTSHALADAVEWKGSSASDGAGSALVVAGDVDGDGFGDLGVSAPVGERVFVLEGPADAGGGLTGADAVLSGPGSSSQFGASLCFGDLNHDGDIDVAVGAPLQDQTYLLPYTDAGQVDLFFGPLSGDLAAASADVTFIDNDEGSGNLGRALASADTDGDGDAELVVSALDNNGLGTLTPVVYLLDTTTGSALVAADVERTFKGSSGRKSGNALSTAGDVDGDGTTDLVLGDSAAGQAFLLLGPLNTAPTTLSSADAVLTGSADFGTSVALLSDLDGDGKDELLVGGNDQAALWMGGADLHGSLSTTSVDLLVSGALSSDEAGTSVGSGDLDGDGHGDLLVGAPGTDAETGSAWALLGPF